MPNIKNTKIGFLIILLTIYAPMSLGGRVLEQKSFANIVDWKSLAGQFKCVFSTKIKTSKIKLQKKKTNNKLKVLKKTFRGPSFSPKLIFKVELEYLGKKPVQVKWDNRFGHLLWDKQFILVIENNKRYIFISTYLTTMTSGIYSSKLVKTLEFGDKLNSVLHLNNNPSVYMTYNMIKADTRFQLYLRKYKNNVNIHGLTLIGQDIENNLMPICNSLNINIK